MCSLAARWGTPDFGRMLVRGRVGELIARAGDRPCILFGSSGCGKSVAASQYSRASGRSTIWVDAGGQFLTGTQLACATLEALSEARQSPIGILELPRSC